MQSAQLTLAALTPGEADGIDASKLLESLEQQHSQATEREDEALIEQSDNSLVRLVNTAIIEAHAQGVSDIHFETMPGRNKLRIRFRKDALSGRQYAHSPSLQPSPA